MNMVIKINTNVEPLELLKELKEIEKTMGRQLAYRNAPRVIDLDILLYGDIQYENPELAIPHPRLHERAFVLIPLNELVPDYYHPVLHKTIGQLKELLLSEQYVRKLDVNIEK